MSFVALTYLIGILVFLVLAHYFAGMESAAICANRARLRQLEIKGDERAAEILHQLSDLQHIIAVVLVGNNICLVMGSLFGRKFFAHYFPPSEITFLAGMVGTKELIDLIILTPLFLIFAEILPKQIFRSKATNALLYLGKPLYIFGIIFLPLLKVLKTITIILLTPLGIKKAVESPPFTKEDLLRLIGTDSSEISPDEKSLERHMIRKIFGLEKTLTREVMKPINDVLSIRLGKETIKSAIDIARTSGYSRFPVFRERVIDLLGYIDIYQILKSDLTDKRLEDFQQPAYYVPETKPIDDLLQQFLKKGESVAIVIDEFGSCCGWITLEDILEEIVGEIEDEFDHFKVDITPEDENIFVMEARIDIDDLNDRLGLSLPKEGYETLAGLIYTRLGEIPRPGDSVTIDNVSIEVLSMTKLKIDRVRIQIKKELDEKPEMTS